MVYSRLRHLLVALWPGLCFTLPASVDPVAVFSVLCLVLALVAVTVLFPLCLLVSLYHALAFRHPRVFLLGFPAPLFSLVNAFPPFVANAWFLLPYTVLLVAIWLWVIRYVKKMMLRQHLLQRVHERRSGISRLKCMLDSHTMVLRIWQKKRDDAWARLVRLDRERAEKGAELARARKRLEDIRERIERRKRAAHRATQVDVEFLKSYIVSCKQEARANQENAQRKACEELQAIRKSRFRDLAASQRREEHWMFLLMKKNARLEGRLKLAESEREASIAAHQIDVVAFENERQAYKAQHSALQGSLDFATAEHRIHVDYCEQHTRATEDRLEAQVAELDATRRTHASQLDTAQRVHNQRVAVLQARNSALEERRALATTARDAIAASYKAHVEQTNLQLATCEEQYLALEGSLAFSTAEHRIHVDHCEHERDNARSRIEELTTELDTTRRTHASQLDAAERLHTEQVAVLEARNSALEEQLTAATTTRDAVAASYKVHVEQTNSQLATHEEQYNALEGSLAFSNAEHRIHINYCEHERDKARSRIEELTAQLAAEQAARAEVQAHYDGLKSRHAIVSEGYAHTEAKLRGTERQLYLEKQRHHTTILAYRAGQHAADALIDTLVAGQPALQTPVGQTRGSLPCSEEPYSEKLMCTSPPSALFDDDPLSMPQPNLVEGSSRDASSVLGSTVATSTAYTTHQTQRSCNLESTLLQSASAKSLYPSPPPSGSTALLDLEPSLPTLPSDHREDSASTTGTLEDDEPVLSGPLVATEARPEQPHIPCSLPSEPSLPPPPDVSTSQLEYDPYLSPSPSTSHSGIQPQPQLSDPELSPILQTSSFLPPPSPSPLPSQDVQPRDSTFDLDFGNESFGANIVTKSTPIFSRWVDAQQQASGSESPSRALSTSRSSIMVRVSDLFSQGWGFEAADSRGDADSAGAIENV